jgi:membrane-bound serine protease (ClpP class)
MLLCPVLASASVVKIRVDAPGGLDTSMREIIETIVNAGMPGAAHPVGVSLMLVKSPIPELRPGLPFVLPVALGVSLIVVFLLTLVLKAHSRRSFSGREGMIGETGTARTDLSPAGKIFVHGEIWEAEADGPVRAGEKVKVVAFLEGLKVKVGKL